MEERDGREGGGVGADVTVDVDVAVDADVDVRAFLLPFVLLCAWDVAAVVDVAL